VIVTCYGAGDVGSYSCIDLALLRSTLHPDTGIDAAFDQYRIGIGIQLDDVALECSERGLIDVHQGCVVSGESAGLARRI
jgi:hypothetical protein